jgi:hypothetical protein
MPIGKEDLAIDAPLNVDEEVLPALQLAGWTPDYRFDTSLWVTALLEDGFRINRHAQHVLERLGGLKIKPIPSASQVSGSGEAIFDPLWAATGESARIAERQRDYLAPEVTMCPVGEWASEFILLMGSDGAMYAETTFMFCRVGRSLSEGLRTIVVADRPIERLGGSAESRAPYR